MTEKAAMIRQAKLLRIYTDKAVYYGDRRVFEVVATRARDAKMAAVTVLKALFGFARSAHVHRRHVSKTTNRSLWKSSTKNRSFVRSWHRWPTCPASG
jgi:hypothetical protein